MRQGAGRKCSRLITVVALVLVTGLATMIMGGCGDTETESINPTTTAAASTGSSSEQPAGGGEGEAVAEEILTTYDAIVAKVADLVKDKPDPATVTPQLEELYASYEPIVAELNARYLALKDGPVEQWGACNTYLGNKRGQHITAADNTLGEAVAHYNLNLGDQDMVSLLHDRPIELLDIAVDQGQ